MTLVEVGTCITMSDWASRLPLQNIFLFFIISSCYLIEFKARELKKIEPDCGRISNYHAGKAHILLDYRAAWLMLSYWLGIWAYQVYMHIVPRFSCYNNVGWKIPIKSLSIFKLMKFLARLNRTITLILLNGRYLRDEKQVPFHFNNWSAVQINTEDKIIYPPCENIIFYPVWLKSIEFMIKFTVSEPWHQNILPKQSKF